MGKKIQGKSVREELESISPPLAKLKAQSSPVKIPERYFDQLSDEVLQRIKREEGLSIRTPEVPRQPWWAAISGLFRRPAYPMALAGIAILLICITVLPFGGPVEIHPELAMSDEDINDYINFHIDDFDLSLLVEESPEAAPNESFMMEGDSLDKEGMDEYFDEWLDEISLEELL
jgi:hypothetical protein